MYALSPTCSHTVSPPLSLLPDGYHRDHRRSRSKAEIRTFSEEVSPPCNTSKYLTRSLLRTTNLSNYQTTHGPPSPIRFYHQLTIGCGHPQCSHKLCLSNPSTFHPRDSILSSSCRRSPSRSRRCSPHRLPIGFPSSQTSTILSTLSTGSTRCSCICRIAAYDDDEYQYYRITSRIPCDRSTTAIPLLHLLDNAIPATLWGQLQGRANSLDNHHETKSRYASPASLPA